MPRSDRAGGVLPRDVVVGAHSGGCRVASSTSSAHNRQDSCRARQPRRRVRCSRSTLLLLLLLLRTSCVVVSAAAHGGTTAVVTTVASTTNNPCGVYIDAPTGVILSTQKHSVLSIYANGTVTSIAGSGSLGIADGIGLGASFNTPWGVAARVTEPNDVFVVDTVNHCVRRVNRSTHSVTKYVGKCGYSGHLDAIGTAAVFTLPRGAALFYNATAGKDTYLYVADTYNHVIRRVDLATANVETFAGVVRTQGSVDGTRATARFDQPYDIAVDSTGRWVYVADTNNHCLRAIDASGSVGLVTTVAGNCALGSASRVDGVGSTARFSSPQGIAIDRTGDVLYVADTGNCVIRRVSTTDGNATTMTRLGCSSTLVDGPLSTARFSYPYGIRYYARNATSSGVDLGVVEEGLVVTDFDTEAIRRIVLGGAVAAASPSSTLSATASQSLQSTATRTQSATAVQHGSASSTASTASFAPSATPSPTHTVITVSTTPTRTATTGSASGTSSVHATGSAATRTRTASTTTSGTAPRSTAHTSITASTSATRAPSHSGRRPTLSLTGSASSWVCGAHDLRNVSLGTAAAEAVGALLPSTARMLAVAPVEGSSGMGLVDVGAAVARFSAAPLPRVALLATRREALPLLLVRLSLRWGGARRWGVVSASSMRHGEALTFNATADATPPPQGTAAAEESRDVTVLLWPPLSSSMGWVEEGLGVYVGTEIVVELGLACTAGSGNTSGHTATVRVVVPAPGAPRELAEKVETTVTAMQWTTAVGGPGAGSAVGRVGAVRSMMLCGGGGSGDEDDNNGGASGGGLVGLRIGCGEDGRVAGGSVAAARGAVAGNAGILGGSIVLVLLLAAAYAAATGERVAVAGLRLAAPSVLLPVWIATLPSTAAGAAELFSESGASGCPSDAATAVAGLLMCCVPLGWICYVALRLVPKLGLQIVATKPAAPSTASSPSSLCCSQVVARLRIIARDSLRANDRWEPPSSSSSSSSTNNAIPTKRAHRNDQLDDSRRRSRHAYVLLREYRVLWYAVVDAGVLVGSGALSAVSGAGSQGLCVGAAASVAAVYAVQLAVCAVWRPFTTRFAFVHALMTLALSATSVGLRVGVIVAASSEAANAASLERQDALSTAAVACDLCVIGITAVRVLVDVIDCCKAVASIAKEMHDGVAAGGAGGGAASARPATDATGPRTADSSASLPPSPHGTPAPLRMLPSDDDDDLLFWDAAGNAVERAPAGEAAGYQDDDDATTVALPPLTDHGGGGSRDGPQPWASDLMVAFGSLQTPTNES